jgi:cation diffusion facilitator CzcD-associated flavoprotein CzcO
MVVRDAIVIGAGITGIHQLHRLTQAGLDAIILEAGSGVGGTWFWNRYPGCRFDSESYTYGYFFSEELRDTWAWSDEYAAQPETERYLNLAVDTLGLRARIELNAAVARAEYDERAGEWQVTTESGEVHRTRFLISAVGVLSAPVYPQVPGLDDFEGEWHHTARWPHEEVSFAGKRVAVIGTGSSGVQVIPFVAKDAASLTVFQRTGNWVTPLNNRPIDAEKTAWIRSEFDAIHDTCMSTSGGFLGRPRPEGGMEVDEAERRRYWQELYDAPGLSMVTRNFRDSTTNIDTNEALTEFIREKIRERVHDPEVAERLIPHDHTFGMKRPPLETGYFEVFNQPNVELVSLRDEPLERFTATGLATSRREFEFDLIVLATGFQAATGSIVRIDIRGEGGRSIAEHWENGPRTWLGLQTAGFPNLFIVGGPQSTTGNIPRSTETQVDLVMRLIARARELGEHTVVATTTDAEESWTATVADTVRGTVLENARSWAFGSNIEDKPRAYLLWAGGIPKYVEHCEAAFADDYRHFEFAGAGR